MFLRNIVTMLFVIVVLSHVSQVLADNSGCECDVQDVVDNNRIDLQGVDSGYLKFCRPIVENIKSDKITYISPLVLSDSGVCLFDELDVSKSESGVYHLSDMIYQRLSLTVSGQCPDQFLDLYTLVPLDLSQAKRIDSYLAIVLGIRDVNSGKRGIGDLLSEVSFFDKFFSAPYSEFKSLLKRSVESRADKGVITGYSVYDNSDMTYVIYYKAGNVNWHLRGRILDGKLKIIGVSS